jgi:hypothetical protein
MTPQARELEVIIKELARWVGRWKRPEVTATAVQPKKEEAAAKAS